MSSSEAVLSHGYQWQTFLDTPPEEHVYETSRMVVVPAPYDSTTSFRSGSRYAPAAIIDASRHLEDFDIELGLDPSSQGIYTLAELSPDLSGPKRVVKQVRAVIGRILSDDKIPVLLGGEHTLTVGSVWACSERYDDLSVLYLDAHADLRESFMGTRWGHASVAKRVSEISPIVEVGVRSLSAEERAFAESAGIPIFYWPQSQSGASLAGQVLSGLTSNVYISIDLDVMDPSIMSAVGTPEPGGMTWWDIIGLLRHVAASTRIVGFDIVELSPEEGPVACSSTAAKLAYKMMGYAAFGGD